jgi:hypothetical protein
MIAQPYIVADGDRLDTVSLLAHGAIRLGAVLGITNYAVRREQGAGADAHALVSHDLHAVAEIAIGANDDEAALGGKIAIVLEPAVSANFDATAIAGAYPHPLMNAGAAPQRHIFAP